MTRWMTAVGALAICVAFAPSLGAQWPSYPTPGVPAERRQAGSRRPGAANA